MISYEKVRQSLKTLNIVIIVLNSLLAVFSIFGIVSILLVMNNEKAVAAMGSEAAAILEQSMTPFSLFVSAVAIALTIAIIVFTVINQSKLKQNQELSYLPYFLHFTVYHDKGKACATCRLLPNKSYKIATLQRMAVLKDYRGDQIGQTLMTYILDYASIQGFEKIELHAQLSAVDFYSKLGFQTIGDHFMEAGIEHVTMEKVLMQP